MSEKPKSNEPVVRRRRITDYSPDPNNANLGSERGQYLIDHSVEQVGAARSIVSAADDTIPIGNHAMQALADVGIEDVIEIETDGKTAVVVKRTDWETAGDPVARKAAYLDNRTSEISLNWNPEQVKLDIESGVDLTDMFRDDELDVLLDEVGGYGRPEPGDDPGAEIDRAEELREKWQTERGQVWDVPSATVAGRSHRVMCGDSTSEADVARLMDGEKVQLIVTSPPYNQGIDRFTPSGMHKEADWVAKVGRLAYADSVPENEYQAQQSAALQLWHGMLNDHGSVFYNHKNRYRDKRVVSPLAWLPGPFCFRQEIIWSRPGSVTQNARMFLPSDERIYWLYKGDDFFFNDATEIKSWSTVWSIGLETNKDHAVGFPVELPRRCIEACSIQGQLVADVYLGSGTTAVAAEQIGRICYGMELEPKYVAVALERLAGMGLEPRLLENDHTIHSDNH